MKRTNYILNLKAPFASFRQNFTGWYRPTLRFMTPSAAYGIILNLAAIDYREKVFVTNDENCGIPSKPGPSVELAIGTTSNFPKIHLAVEQLHSYRKSLPAKEIEAHEKQYKGNKDNITPVRREYLYNCDFLIALRGNSKLVDRVQEGLAGCLEREGIPFVGESHLLFDVVEETNVNKAMWLVNFDPTKEKARPGLLHLPVKIDRRNFTNTKSLIFAPEVSDEIPEKAWVLVSGDKNV